MDGLMRSVEDTEREECDKKRKEGARWREREREREWERDLENLERVGVKNMRRGQREV